MKFLPCLLLCSLLLISIQFSVSQSLESKQIEQSDYLHPRFGRAAILNHERLWNGGIIPYEFDSSISLDKRELFRQAMKSWEDSTCLVFAWNRVRKDRDYILFTSTYVGCFSAVGKRGGQQIINIGEGCSDFRTILHEIGHAIGYFHEQQRPDRNNYVKINSDNIEKDEEDQFKALNNTVVDSLGEAYDYKSIMHYKSTEFAKPGRETVVPLWQNEKLKNIIGRIHELSEGDVRQTNKLYNCPNTKVEDASNCDQIIRPVNGQVLDSIKVVGKKRCKITIEKDPRYKVTIRLTRINFECKNKNDRFNIFSRPYNVFLGSSDCLFGFSQTTFKSKDNLEIVIHSENRSVCEAISFFFLLPLFSKSFV